MKEKQPPVGRFAPSPSGRMHLGNVFCALLAWLAARAEHGTIILRHEDLDPERCPRRYAEQLEEDLLWLGLDWDEGGSRGGPHGPYYQSERTRLYEDAYELLQSRGLVYPCFCSRAELHASEAPHLSDGRILYSGRCRHLTEEERQALAAHRRPAGRLMVPDEEVGFLDDALMGVTQVVRGRDLLDSTPRQLYLYRLLGYLPPDFGHIPLLLDPAGARLSKRDAALDLGVLRKRFSAQEILGILACAGGLLDRPEPVAARELIPLFAWEKLPCKDVRLPASLWE